MDNKINPLLYDQYSEENKVKEFGEIKKTSEINNNDLVMQPNILYISTINIA